MKRMLARRLLVGALTLTTFFSTFGNSVVFVADGDVVYAQDDLGADSLDVFQIIMGLEDEFDIEIPPEKAESITTVGEAVELIRKELN